jgi:hypothetical protein
MTDLQTSSAERLAINDLEYLEMTGLNVMLAHDYYPESHQGGVGIIQNGLRVATNGDVRLEPTPGQWSPVPVVGPRIVDRERQEISVRMSYPDESKNRRGFNPIEYPDLHLAYVVRIHPSGAGFRIVVHMETPVPEEWRDRIGFNLELFPGYLFGKTYRIGDAFGIFPQQANGPGEYGSDGAYEIAPLGTGSCLVVAPESDHQRMTIEAVKGGELRLIDGRGLHNNGWYVVRALLEGDDLEWQVTPHAIPGWRSEPVIQVSQVGYHRFQPKAAVIELDPRDTERHPIGLLRIGPHGTETVHERQADEWGRFLRYHYLRFDFSDVREPGMYVVRYGDRMSSPFAIDDAVFRRGVWQPTVDTFLPVQMCHMRVVENYRVWHGACHLDDARMAPTDLNHFDGYVQGSSTLCPFESGERVPGLDRGGWHDAGDYDLRVESQCHTIYGLALAYEQFGLDYDNTTVDQERRIVELQRPDGKPDVLQQIEHGVLSVVGGYNALGRLYRGIIEPTLEQYVHLGDAATQTDNVPSNDDRWVFTEENPGRELDAAAALAAASRVLGVLDEVLAQECLRVAKELYDRTEERQPLQRLGLAVELLQATGEARYREWILAMSDEICKAPERVGWLAARSLALVGVEAYAERVRESLSAFRAQVDEMERKTPYGLPYEPDIWGAGWGIQRFGVEQYWLHVGCPDIFPIDYMLHAINFVLGCHPGPNTTSFVSGVGSKSLIPGYGVNRADWGYIPGGSGSGTALIRPDFPELLEWPYLWQQTEYCLGYPTSDYVFLIAAAHHLLNRPIC